MSVCVFGMNGCRFTLSLYRSVLSMRHEDHLKAALRITAVVNVSSEEEMVLFLSMYQKQSRGDDFVLIVIWVVFFCYSMHVGSKLFFSFYLLLLKITTKTHM